MYQNIAECEQAASGRNTNQKVVGEIHTVTELGFYFSDDFPLLQIISVSKLFIQVTDVQFHVY